MSLENDVTLPALEKASRATQHVRLCALHVDLDHIGLDVARARKLVDRRCGNDVTPWRWAGITFASDSRLLRDRRLSVRAGSHSSTSPGVSVITIGTTLDPLGQPVQGDVVSQNRQCVRQRLESKNSASLADATTRDQAVQTEVCADVQNRHSGSQQVRERLLHRLLEIAIEFAERIPPAVSFSVNTTRNSAATREAAEKCVIGSPRDRPQPPLVSKQPRASDAAANIDEGH